MPSKRKKWYRKLKIRHIENTYLSKGGTYLIILRFSVRLRNSGDFLCLIILSKVRMNYEILIQLTLNGLKISSILIHLILETDAKKTFDVNELVQAWNEWKIWECPTNAMNFYSCLGDVYIQTSLIFLDFNVISPGLRINIFFGFLHSKFNFDI